MEFQVHALRRPNDPPIVLVKWYDATKWTDQEEALLLRLRGEGKTRREIAQALQRQPSAISSRLRKIERRTDEWPDKTTPE